MVYIGEDGWNGRQEYWAEGSVQFLLRSSESSLTVEHAVDKGHV